MIPEMSYRCWSLLRSMQWSVVTKAAERSKIVTRETVPESCAGWEKTETTDS